MTVLCQNGTTGENIYLRGQAVVARHMHIHVLSFAASVHEEYY